MKDGVKELAAAFKPPYQYDEFGQRVLDANSNVIIEIRGWGRLIGRGAGGMALGVQTATRIQNDFGTRVTLLLNELVSGTT